MQKRTLLYLFSLVSVFGYGQEEWNLEKCIFYAIEHSIDVTQAGYSIKTAQINTKESENQKYPTLNFGSNLNLNFGRALDPTTDAFVTSSFLSNGVSLSTNVTLFAGGRINKSIEQRRLLERVADADKQSVINLLTVNIINSYLEVLFSQDNYNNSAVQLKTINDQLDQMNKMVDAGSRAKFELFDLEAQKASFEQELTIAQNRIDIGYLNLKGFLNLPSDYDMVVTTPPLDQDVYTSIDLVTLEEAYTKAIAFQPRAKSLSAQIQSSQLAVEIAKGAYLPTLSLNGNLFTNFSNQAKEVVDFSTFQSNSNVLIDGNPSVISINQQVPNLKKSPYFSQLDNNFAYGLGLNLNVPIYNNYSTKANEERAKVDLDNLLAEKDKNQVDVKNLIMSLITDARAAKRSLDASQKTLDARQIAFENAEKRYALGAINSYEFINSQDQLSTAQTNLLISRYDYMFKAKVLDYYQGYAVKLK